MSSTSFSMVIALLALTCPFALGDRDRQQDVVEVADGGHFRRNLGVETLEAALDDANTGACGERCKCECNDKWKPNSNANETGLQDLLNDVENGRISRSDCEQALFDANSLHYEKICSQTECPPGSCEPCQDADSGVFQQSDGRYKRTRKASVQDVWQEDKVCKTCWRGSWVFKAPMTSGNCGQKCPPTKPDEFKFSGSKPKGSKESVSSIGSCSGSGKSESSRRQCQFELTYSESKSSNEHAISRRNCKR